MAGKAGISSGNHEYQTGVVHPDRDDGSRKAKTIAVDRVNMNAAQKKGSPIQTPPRFRPVRRACDRTGLKTINPMVSMKPTRVFMTPT